MKKYFRVTVKDLCRIGVLTAITAILAMFFTFRVGNTLKIPMKFISVFITGVFYGPVWAAVSAAIGDILNAVLMPVGGIMPQITLVEFLSGAIYGVCFYKRINSKSFILMALICVVMQLLLDTFLTSYFLAEATYFPSFTAAVTLRFPCSILKAALQSVVILPSRHYLRGIGKLINRGDMSEQL